MNTEEDLEVGQGMGACEEGKGVGRTLKQSQSEGIKTDWCVLHLFNSVQDNIYLSGKAHMCSTLSEVSPVLPFETGPLFCLAKLPNEEKIPSGVMLV